MSKTKASTNLDMPKNRHKHSWNQIVIDAERRLAQAKRKVDGLEEALEVFRRNAADGMPIPGQGKPEFLA